MEWPGLTSFQEPLQKRTTESCSVQHHNRSSQFFSSKTKYIDQVICNWECKYTLILLTF
jgi:hypothetical protein